LIVAQSRSWRRAGTRDWTDFPKVLLPDHNTPFLLLIATHQRSYPRSTTKRTGNFYSARSTQFVSLSYRYLACQPSLWCPPAPLLEALAFNRHRNQHHAFLSHGATGSAKRRWFAAKVGTAVLALATLACH
jgi:hypothetical protein